MSIDIVFPKLLPGQTALLRAESQTGHVLDDNFAIAISDHQNVFTIFDSEVEAKNYAKEVLTERNDVECNIYGYNQELICVWGQHNKELWM
jgi:hypothetical protein